MQVLSEPEWRARASAHAERVDARVVPHLERRADGLKHPVHDFLFTYYNHRPAQLRRWHPGFGVALEGADELVELRGYDHGPAGATVSPTYVASQRRLLRQLHLLLTATARRTPQVGCFGLHEWAMVHRLPAEQVRHAAWPLRLGGAGTDAVVESHRIACSHFDAFRFFTPSARPLNTLQPRRDDRADFEQPGCLHAGMDLYKHAFRLSPMVPSDLVADCFELAWDIRALDMRASPYDLSALTPGPGEDWSPVRIETAEGKREYATAQRAFADRAAPLRAALIGWCERLLDVADGAGGSGASEERPLQKV